MRQSHPAGEAPCPNGGHLLGFDADALGPIETVRPDGPRLDPGWLDHQSDAIADRAGLSFVLDFGEIRERSSASLGGLIQLKRRLGTDAGRWIVRLLDPGLREVFRITRRMAYDTRFNPAPACGRTLRWGTMPFDFGNGRYEFNR